VLHHRVGVGAGILARERREVGAGDRRAPSSSDRAGAPAADGVAWTAERREQLVQTLALLRRIGDARGAATSLRRNAAGSLTRIGAPGCLFAAGFFAAGFFSVIARPSPRRRSSAIVAA